MFLSLAALATGHSYYNDAIYDYSPQSNKNNNGAVSNSKNNGTYYKDYFSNKALQANQKDIYLKNRMITKTMILKMLMKMIT